MQRCEGLPHIVEHYPDRFFEQNDVWFFATREGLDVGPFDSKDEAENGLELYLAYMQTEGANAYYALEMARKGLWQKQILG